MKLMTILLFLFIDINVFGTGVLLKPDTVIANELTITNISVDKCTPWNHLKCVYITSSEVYKAGKSGVKSKHWWTMSYIGKECTKKHGIVLGKLFEGVFALPHYIGVGFANIVGVFVYKSKLFFLKNNS